MTTMTDTEVTETAEELGVRQWRFGELERAGYGWEAAALLASRTDVDLHVACALLRAGCSEETALEILL